MHRIPAIHGVIRIAARRTLVGSALALLLLAGMAAGLSSASASVTGLTITPGLVDPGEQATLTVRAEDGQGDLTIVVTDGSLSTPVCGGSPCSAVEMVSARSARVPDLANSLGMVTITFTAPAAGPATVIAIASQGGSQTAAIEITSGSGAGTIITGRIPENGGFGLIVFGGGTYGQLVAATDCPGDQVVFWATTPEGEFVIFLPLVAVPALNEGFQSLFPEQYIPPYTPLIGRCHGGIPIPMQ